MLIANEKEESDASKSDSDEITFSAGAEFTCNYCGDKFQIDYSRKGRPKFCSQECHYASREEKVELTCEECGDSFTRVQSQVDFHDHHFCSRDCWNSHQNNKVTVKCVVCGNEEKVTSFRAENYVACSNECHNEWQKESHSGESNPRYRDDIDDENIIRLYKEGYSLRGVAVKVNTNAQTVIDRLEEHGIERRITSELGHTSETKRGETVRSTLEKQVADYLYEQGVDYEYEPEWFDGPYIPDLVVSDEEATAVIEVWGLTGNSDYDEKRSVKQEWYVSNGYWVVGVTPDDMADLQSILSGIVGKFSKVENKQ